MPNPLDALIYGVREVQDEGTPLVLRSKINFVGAGVSCTDDTANGRTNVTISSGAVPTGTGFVHITSGSQDGAAKLVDTADINNDQVTDAKLRNGGACSVIGRAANSSGDPADISAGSDNLVLKRASNALSFATIVNADVDAAAAIAGTKISPDFGSQNIATTGVITLGGSASTTGEMRTKNAFAWKARNAANSADGNVISNDSSNFINIGDGTFNGAIIYDSSGSHNFRVSGTNALVLESNVIETCAPIIGFQNASSPYGHDGGVVSAHTDANYTVPAGEYKYVYVDFTTACTAGRDITWPNPSSKARGYMKIVRNVSTQTLTHKAGSGSYAQPTSTVKMIWIEPNNIVNLT